MGVGIYPVPALKSAACRNFQGWAGLEELLERYEAVAAHYFEDGLNFGHKKAGVTALLDRYSFRGETSMQSLTTTINHARHDSASVENVARQIAWGSEWI